MSCSKCVSTNFNTQKHVSSSKLTKPLLTLDGALLFILFSYSFFTFSLKAPQKDQISQNKSNPSKRHREASPYGFEIFCAKLQNQNNQLLTQNSSFTWL